ncbi:MAG: insulinase family protein [Candidatus Cloacimonetes bacterium]|nr:insulinase family protein [Candidatus Cloacimonadota bacterium]
MKKLILISTLLLIVALLNGNELMQKTLPNGMEIVVKENNLNESIGFYCFVKTGSVNEGKYLGAGISHYLEHIVSSGTTTFRTEDEYEKKGKEMGALVNAYTTYAATAFYIAVEKQYKDETLKILSEQMQACVCDSFEVAREKQVILKEIVMRSTPARSKIYQRNNELVFPNSNNKYPVIGYTELYKTITRDELEDYYKQRYAPNNMIFVAVGDFAAEEMLTQIEDTFKDFPRKQLDPVYLPVQNPRSGSLEYIEEFDVEQPMVFSTTIIPTSDFGDIIALNTAMDILFRKRKSPIRYKLVEELKLVNYVYGYANGSDIDTEGTIVIRFEAKDPSRVKEIISIIDSEIEKYSKSGIEQEHIRNLINRTKAQKLLSTPSVSNDANQIGWTMMMYGVPDYYPAHLALLEKLTPEKLQDAIRKHLLPMNRIVFYAVPLGTKAILEKKDETASEKSEIEKIEVKNNLTLLYKKNTEKPLLKCVIQLPISSDYETIENAGTISFMIEQMFRGSKNYSSLDISEWQEDHAVSLETYTSTKGTFIEFKCLKDDFPAFKKMLFDAFKNPAFEKTELDLAKEEVKADYNRSKSRAETVHRDFMKSVLYQNYRAGLSKEELTNIIINLKEEKLFDLHKDLFKSKKVIITLFGDITIAEAKNIAADIKAHIPNKKINIEKFYSITSSLNDTFVNEYKFEQVNIDLGCKAPSINDDDFIVMQLIEMILSGARGRLHQAVRGDNDLAYYAFPDYRYGENDGSFRLTSQTSIDKKDDLVRVMQNELEKLKTEEVSIEEITSAIEEQEKMLRTFLNENSMPYYITYYEAIGLGYDYIDRVSDIYKQVSQKDIQRVANKYFENVAIIISEPSEDVELMVE